MCAYTWRPEGDVTASSSVAFYLIMRRCPSLRQSFLFGLGWPVSQPQESCLHLPSAGILDPCHPSWVSMWMPGVRMHTQHWLSHSHSPRFICSNSPCAYCIVMHVMLIPFKNTSVCYFLSLIIFFYFEILLYENSLGEYMLPKIHRLSFMLIF